MTDRENQGPYSHSNPRTRKISPDQRLVIRRRYRNGERQADIAVDYSVTAGAIAYHCTGIDRSERSKPRAA